VTDLLICPIKTGFEEWISNLLGEALANLMPKMLEEDFPEDVALIGVCKN
jgi:hypothetical protein